MTEPVFEVLPGYWPGRSGLFWWGSFSAAEVRRDFERTVELGFKSLSVQLTWNDFQPTGHGVSAAAMRALERTLGEADDAGLRLEVIVLAMRRGTVLWLPSWALIPGSDGGRAVMSGHHASRWQSRDLYRDPVLLAAEARLIREVTGEFGAHPACHSWVLADGATQAARPSSAEDFRAWLAMLVDGAAPSARERGLRCGIDTDDLLRSRAVDLEAFREQGIGVRLGTDWQPPWAPDSPLEWAAFLSAYADRLTGRAAAVIAPFAPNNWAATETTTGVEQFATGLAEGGAVGAGVASLFSLSPDAVRGLPPGDRTAWTRGLIGGDGELTPAGAAWTGIAAARLPGKPIPEAMPAVDAELRLREPEQVARDCLAAFLR